MRLIVITGTPGTGKTTIAKRVAKRIPGAELVSVNKLIREKRLFTSRASDGTMIAEMRRLRLELAGLARRSRSKVLILEGHLLCDISIRGATAIVVRQHLPVLLRRLLKRGYAASKIRENIVSEATDYCGIHAAERYGRAYEVVDGKGSVNEILRIINGRGKAKTIDLLPELESVIRRNRRFAI